MTSSPACVILSAPYSGAAVLAAMLGRHPALCAVPELNLAMAPTMRELLHIVELSQGPIADGLLRSVARLAFHHTDDAGIERAHDWLSARSGETTSAVLHEIASLAAPRGLVMHDTECGLRPNDLLRLCTATAPAPILHLVRHPWSQGVVAADRLGDRLYVAPDFKDHATAPPCLDPQLAWLRGNRNIAHWIGAVAPERYVSVSWEQLVSNPVLLLDGLCARLNVSTDPATLDAMVDYERWEFWGYGPRAAPFGLDAEALEPLSEDLLDAAFAGPALDRRLPWRPDDGRFAPEVVSLARQFGYA